MVEEKITYDCGFSDCYKLLNENILFVIIINFIIFFDKLLTKPESSSRTSVVVNRLFIFLIWKCRFPVHLCNAAMSVDHVWTLLNRRNVVQMHIFMQCTSTTKRCQLNCKCASHHKSVMKQYRGNGQRKTEMDTGQSERWRSRVGKPQVISCEPSEHLTRMDRRVVSLW